MESKIGKETKRELLEALRNRYRVCAKKEKARILDEFTAVSGYHRKHAIRLLGKKGVGMAPVETALTDCQMGQRVYDEAVREALIVVWEADKRLIEYVGSG